MDTPEKTTIKPDDQKDEPNFHEQEPPIADPKTLPPPAHEMPRKTERTGDQPPPAGDKRSN